MLRTACLFIFMLIAGACFAAPDTITMQKKPAELVMDTTTVEKRQLDKAALDAYKRQPSFNYDEEMPAGGPSLWTRFWRWFWSLFDFSGLQSPTTFTFLKYFFILIGVAALVLLVLKLNGINVLNLFRKKPYASLAYSESIENIHEIDFHAEIEKAIAVGNYRLAVRLLYLSSLKQLSDNGLINWQINKTNTDYVYELTNNQQREAFKQLTLQFEYVWYGDFLINADIFKRVNLLFNDFKSIAA
jgi:hypothetical protein